MISPASPALRVRPTPGSASTLVGIEPGQLLGWIRGELTAPVPAAVLPAQSHGIFHDLYVGAIHLFARSVIFLKKTIPGFNTIYNALGAIGQRWRLPQGPALRNMGMLSPTLFRGAQPSETSFQTLKDQGFDTVINLRAEDNTEAPRVNQLGMKAIYQPQDGMAAPSNAQTLDFLSAVTDPANGKVFFHCYAGSDRTGTMAAAYRIAHDGWTTAAAVAELPRYHFHAPFEQAKLDYVEHFAAYWHGLPPHIQARVLHLALHV